jgi:lipopolysaccharide heptosyltransferase II
MAHAVLRLLNDRKLAADLVVNAKKKLEEKFTLEHMASQTLKVYQELLEGMHILVIKISSIGDVILATASLKALRKKFPLAKIYCLVGKESRKVLQRCPYLDGIIILDPKNHDRGFMRLLKFSRKLRHFKFDKIIDFQNNSRSHLLTLLSFPKESYGYKRGSLGFVLTHPVKNSNPNLSPVEHQFQVLQPLDIAYKGGKEAFLELWPTEKDEKYARSLLDSEWLGNSSHIVGMCLAASDKWETKNWPVEYSAKLCDLLAKENVRVLITGLEKDRPIVDQLLKLTKTKPAVFIGKTDIMELAALIKCCKVFVTPDSAPLHVAAAMQVPYVAFFGPTSSARHLPPAKEGIILERGLNCQPCYSPKCKITTHACMREITPEDVANRVKDILARSP